eukprot:symbB.v1.2.021404.t1/scaffold1771.1/size122269/6
MLSPDLLSIWLCSLGPPFHGKGVGFSGPMTAEGMTPKVKRQRDENMEPNRQVDLTEEQKARVERNRQLALARRGERQAAATAAPSNTGNASVLGALTEQQLDKIRANREAFPSILTSFVVPRAHVKVRINWIDYLN